MRKIINSKKFFLAVVILHVIYFGSLIYLFGNESLTISSAQEKIYFWIPFVMCMLTGAWSTESEGKLSWRVVLPIAYLAMWIPLLKFVALHSNSYGKVDTTWLFLTRQIFRSHISMTTLLWVRMIYLTIQDFRSRKRGENEKFVQ